MAVSAWTTPSGVCDSPGMSGQLTCERCRGHGAVHNEDWLAFEEWRERHPVIGSEAEDDLVEQYFIVVRGHNDVPPMQEPCRACSGSGGLRAA